MKRRMIIDCHTHAWTYWPYQPEVPDPGSRGRAERLLWEMDQGGVDKAVLVNARIDHNPENNEYGLECALNHPDRFINFADVDCSWWPPTGSRWRRCAPIAPSFAQRTWT